MRSAASSRAASWPEPDAAATDMLVHLRARPDTLYVSHGRTVLATGVDGFIAAEGERGFFVHETRLLSRYRYFIDGHAPLPTALSNIEQHSWLGYYIVHVPGTREVRDQGSGGVESATEESLELLISRCLADGMHE